MMSAFLYAQLLRSQWPCPGVYSVPTCCGKSGPGAGKRSLKIKMRPGDLPCLLTKEFLFLLSAPLHHPPMK